MPRKKTSAPASQATSPHGSDDEKTEHVPAGDGQPVDESPADETPVNKSPVDKTPATVGVGASAGGLEAFSQLLRALPEKIEFAIVLVQHLAPQHESSLASLLASFTKIPVLQLSENEWVQANRVYVIPPNRGLILRSGMLVLQPRPTDRTQYTPIDIFFDSLASDLKADAIGVVLSGTASDGVQGIHAIKAAGGTVLVQDPGTAQHDGMPRSALATGKVDYELSPAEIAEALIRLVRDRPPHTIVPRVAGDQMVLEAPQREQIFTLLQAASGVDFRQYKLPTIQRRIQRRMALHKVVSVDQYLQYLRDYPAEANNLYSDILIHVTRFFREPASFAVLAEEVFPSVLQDRDKDAPLRIWVPACSTGEEPYSVAITLMESCQGHSHNMTVQIFATDISETAIEQARAGLYPESIAADLSPERLDEFFTKVDGHYRINKSIRDQCVFARQDLTSDPPFSRLDLIVCRNVLIYLGQPVQSRLMSVFHYALKPTGYLMLGSAETTGSQDELFAVANKRHRVYRKKQRDTSAGVLFSAPYDRRPTSRDQRAAPEPRPSPSQVDVNRIVLERYAPPGVVVDEELRILQFRGQTGRFLEPAAGDASLNLLKMCREGLMHGLRTAIHEAKENETPIRREGLRVRQGNNEVLQVTIEVTPLRVASGGRNYLIVFLDAKPLAVAPAKPQRAAGKGEDQAVAEETQAEIERLQNELIASRGYLQSIIQDVEATNEELQSANEEVLSSNEELQSTNEELDTAREELQSTNEELNTLNEELHGRNDELARINSDLINLLNGVQVAIVFVDNHLRIRRFTPMAEKVLNLIPGDIGRPIGQIKPNLNCPDLERWIWQVVDTVSVEYHDVQDLAGREFSLTIRPYKSIDNRIEGAVLILLDVDETRQHEHTAREFRELSEAILGTVREPLVVLDGNLRVKRVNPAFCRMFGVSREETENQLLAELGDNQWNIPRLSELLQTVLASNKSFELFEVEHDFPGIGGKRMRLNARRIAATNGREPLILLAMEEAGETG
ncbi:MAG: CheR family methyltransferase [Pirellulaceae bacterium]